MNQTIQMNQMTQMNQIQDDYLEHYGRLGQKWGQHIFGKDKEPSSKRKKRSNIEKAKAKLEKKKAQAERKAALKKAAEEKRRRDILNDPSKLYKHRREFSVEEINMALKQFEWEKKLNDMSVAKLETGKKKTDAILGQLNNALTGYNQLARVVNTFSNGIELPYLDNVKSNKKKDKK